MEDEEEEEEEEEFGDASSALLQTGLQFRGLSPVAEVSPEVASTGSSESLDKHTNIESELNMALSRLSTLTDELNEVEQSVLESRQIKVTETVTIENRKNSLAKSDDSFEG